MSGDLDDDTLAQIATGYLVKRDFVTCFFDEGTQGFWDDLGNVELADGVVYQGTGKVGSISSVPATTDGSLPGVSAVLSGLDNDVLTAFFTKTYHMRKIVLRSWLFDPGLRTVNASPLWSYTGLMSKATRGGGSGQKSTLTIAVEDAMRRSVVSSIAIRSDGDQRLRLSTDTAFQYVGSVGKITQYWGTAQPAATTPPTITGLPPVKI